MKEVAFSHPIKWTFNNDKITKETTISTLEFKWEYWQKLVIGNDIVLGYKDKTTVYMIPTSAFTPEQLAQFKIWAKANVKEVIG